MKITIVGMGVMGTMFQNALLKKKVFKKNEIAIVDRDDKTVVSDVILFAVKPQDFKKAAKRFKGEKDKLIISIMAGVSIENINESLPGNKIVKSMPNLGTQVGESMTVWKSEGKLLYSEQKLIKKIFRSIGEELQVNNEDLIDAATAASGSGPGFIYFFARKMIQAAKDLGFRQEDAEKLVRQTFKGAIAVWEKTDLPVEVLENKVTSKKGTTEAGINSFRENKVGLSIIKGIKTAYQRAKDLSKL